MNDRLQIATHLMAAMLGQAISERYDDFSQFAMAPASRDALARYALGFADALLRTEKQLSDQTSADYRQSQEEWQKQQR